MRVLARFLVVGAVLASCASADNAPAPRPTRELAAGGARLRGGGVRMDVQLGRGLARRPGKAGATAIAPHAAVTP